MSAAGFGNTDSEGNTLKTHAPQNELTKEDLESKQVMISRQLSQRLDAYRKVHGADVAPPIYLDQNGLPRWISRKERKAMQAQLRRAARKTPQPLPAPTEPPTMADIKKSLDEQFGTGQPRKLAISHGDCNYMTEIGTVCNKCGGLVEEKDATDDPIDHMATTYHPKEGAE